MTVRNRRINEKPGMGHGRAHNAEKRLSFCRLTKQRLINELADRINERYGWYDDASPDRRPKFRVFTEKALAEDLLEGVFVDPLPCGGQSAGLYHVLAPRSTRLGTLLRPALPIVFPCRDGQKEGSSKRKFLYVN
jgi:hypothetical protein